MASTFWALFQAPGTGGFSSAGWIRQGRIDGATFSWVTGQIAFPDLIWSYLPDHSYTGYLAVDPNDNTLLWVCATVDTGGITLRSRCYLYDTILNTWTLLLDLAFIGPSTPFVVDMAFDPDGHTFLAIGGNGALGESGGVGEGGVYMSVSHGMFTAAGAGRSAGYHSGNINNPQSLTALDLAPASTGTRTLYTGHNLVKTTSGASAGWVTSFSVNDGTTWAEPPTFWGGNNFMLACLAVLRLVSDMSGLWWASDNSGSGAYSTANLTARIHGTPATGPNMSFGGGIFSSGSIPYPFMTDPTRAVAFPTSVNTGQLSYTADGGGSWTGFTRPTGHDQGFSYRGGRAARDSLTCAGVAHQRADDGCDIWWSDDGGVTWFSDTAESSGSGLSLDFGAPVPPAPGTPRQETATFRDARGFTADVRFYVSGLTDDDARTAARNIVGAIINASTAEFLGASGPWSTAPIGGDYPTPDSYVPIETRLEVQFTCSGVSAILSVPAPADTLFLDDQETVNLLNPAYALLTSVGIGDNLCTRGGLLADAYVGGRRMLSARRRRQTIRTRQPDLIGPSE